MNISDFENFLGLPFAILLSFSLQPFFLRVFHSDNSGGGEWKFDVLTKYSVWLFVFVCIALFGYAMTVVDPDQIKRLILWSIAILVIISMIFQFIFKVLTAFFIPYRVINFVLVVIMWLYGLQQLSRWF